MSKALKAGFAGVVVLLFSAPLVFPQSSPLLLYQKNGAASNDRLGYSTARVGDVNNDGKDDFIIGAPGAIYTGIGKAYVYSGADGSLLYQYVGPNCRDEFGFSVSGAGDINGDGRADFIIGAPHELQGPGCGSTKGNVFVYSGLDGTLLYQKEGSLAGDMFGYSVDGLGDVNSDGKSDFIVGAPFNDAFGDADCGSAYIYSGATGLPLHQHTGHQHNYPNGAGDLFGWSVAGTGDVNSDGIPDYIIGSPYANYNFITRGGVYVLSGTGYINPIYWKAGVNSLDWFGYSVDGGDVNADGKADFIVGARLYEDAGGPTNSGSAFVYSGLDGTLLHQKNGVAAEDNFGSSVAVTGKVNGDSYNDFIIGAPSADPGGVNAAGSAFLYSGINSSLLFQKDGTAAIDNMGLSVNGAGDLNGDGYQEFIISAPQADPGFSNAGSAFVYGYELTPPSVTVTDPNGGEYVSYTCCCYTITWNATDNVGVTGVEIRLDRQNDGTFEWLIANLSGNPGSYEWDATPNLATTTAKIKVIASDAAGNAGSDVSNNTFTIGSLCILKPAAALPTFDLDQNYPNPFNANTNISFSLDEESRVELVVYNILGEKVRTLVSGERSVGSHDVPFDGRDDKGMPLSSGTYFYKLTAGERVVTKQMTLIK